MAGGDQPRWRPDGKGTLLRGARRASDGGADCCGDGQADIADGRASATLRDVRLASGSGISGVVIRSKPQYAVAPDGRFLMNMAVDAETATPITVVLNWTAALKK